MQAIILDVLYMIDVPAGYMRDILKLESLCSLTWVIIMLFKEHLTNASAQVCID